MLGLRPNCECCDTDLPPASAEAVICSFEYTFCRTCAEDKLNWTCPTCDENLVECPIRPAMPLAEYPVSTKRVLKSGGCGQGEGAAV